MANPPVYTSLSLSTLFNLLIPIHPLTIHLQKENFPMHIVPDVSDIFVPLPFFKVCWLNIHNDQDKINEFLDQLPSFVKTLNEPYGCVGSVLAAANIVLVYPLERCSL